MPDTPAPEEDIRTLHKRVAMLNDWVLALLDPAWGAENGILPDDHPLHPGTGMADGSANPSHACGASTPGVGSDPLGPCVLRHGHDGPVHQAASGATGWPTPDITVDDRMPPQPANACPCGGGDFDGERIHALGCPVHPARLHAIEAAATAALPPEARDAGLRFEYATPPLRVTACDAGRHRAHPGETCEDYETERAVAHAAWESMFTRILRDTEAAVTKQMTNQMLYGPAGRPVPYGIHATDVPASLRGPAARPPAEGGRIPTRDEAAHAIAALTPPIRLLADGEDPWAAPPVVPAALLRAFEQQAVEMDAHADAVEAAIARVETEHCPDDIIRIPRGTCSATLADHRDAARIFRCTLPADHETAYETFHHSADGHSWTDGSKGAIPNANAVEVQCRAECHDPGWRARCDLITGHRCPHRDRGIRWTEDVAIYPTDTTKD